jgi:hypothetical protein
MGEAVSLHLEIIRPVPHEQQEVLQVESTSWKLLKLHWEVDQVWQLIIARSLIAD